MTQNVDEGIFLNPFEDINAAYMEDEQILRYWSSPKGFLEHGKLGGVEFVGLLPNIIYGGRGTGKTTVLKYLSFDIQEKKFTLQENDMTLSGFLSTDRKFIGIYYRFDGPLLTSFRGKGIDEETWNMVFIMFFELVLGQKYLNAVERLINKGAIKLQISEKDICGKICVEIFGNEIDELDSLNKIRKKLSSMQYEIEQWKDEIALHKTELAIKPVPKNRILFGIPRICKDTMPELSDKLIFYLLDEYENLEEKQQVIINTLLKHTQYPVSFKVGSRINGLKTHSTTNASEHLREGSDYREVSFDQIIKLDSSDYSELLQNIANIRIKTHHIFSNVKDVSIMTLLGKTPSFEDEALEIVKTSKNHDRHFRGFDKLILKQTTDSEKAHQFFENISFPENPLIEKLNMLLLERGFRIERIRIMMNAYLSNEKNEDHQRYKYLYEKNKLGLLFQLIRDYHPKNKKFTGFEMFVMLSSGIIRTFLELCYYAFNESIFNDSRSLALGKKISDDDQTKAVEKKSAKFMKDTLSIPGDLGPKIYGFVDNIGTIFTILHMNPRLSEPEPTYFSTDYTKLDPDTKKIIDTATMWSIFHMMESMDPKDMITPRYTDFMLNHILSPYYSISYRKRGRTVVHPEYLKLIIFGSETEQQKIKQLVEKNGANFLSHPPITYY